MNCSSSWGSSWTRFSSRTRSGSRRTSTCSQDASSTSSASSNSTLAELDLSGNYVGALGATALAQGIKSNEGLTEIRVNGNELGDDAFAAFVDALVEHKGNCMREVDVGNNGAGLKGAEAVGRLLLKETPQDDADASAKVGGSLQKLNLYMNEMGDAGISTIAEALEKNTSLTWLDVGGNNIGPKGADHVSRMLSKNRTLATLEFGYNPIGPEGMESIAEAVKFAKAADPGLGETGSKGVTELHLGWCKGGPKGAASFADALRFNETLTHLDLRGNNLADEGTVALAESLKVVNDCLKKLDLGYNEIKDDGAFALSRALKSNPEGSVTSLLLNNNYISKFGEVALQESADFVREMRSADEEDEVPSYDEEGGLSTEIEIVL